MIKQIKYFQAVVPCNSFSKEVEECFVSQSAISQQIQALDKELSIRLLNRDRRKISLTKVGDLFYRKNLVIISDFDRFCAEILKLSDGSAQELSIGYLRHYRGHQLHKTLIEFQAIHPEISINLLSGIHEELYDYLRTGKVDVVFSGLRCKPSKQ